MVGFVRSLIFEIKDLTCNAQFNFCLLFDRSEFAHSAAASGLRLRSRSRVTNSRIKLSKIAALRKLPGNKKLNLGADFKVSRLTTLGHCRDKIEFNLKSQKLEELAALSSNPACVAGRAL